MAEPKLDQGNEPHGGLAIVVLDTYEDPEVAQLRLIRSEIARVTEVLGGLGFTETAEDLVGKDGRSLSLRQQLAGWKPNRGRVLFYWVGHGRSAGEGDIWLYGQDTGREPQPAITLTGRELGRILAGKAVDQIVLILDACQAGVGARVITGAFATAVDQRASPGPLEPSLAVITSAGPDEYAREGVFASALIEVLREGPPEDASRDWWTERDEYIWPQELAAALRVVLHKKDARQRPNHHMEGNVMRFFRNPRHIAYGPDVEVEAKRRRGAWLPSDVREHFMIKFRGIDTADERGWYFTGREQPLREIAEWLQTARSGLLLVTGPPGCGKSAILGRLAVLSDKGYRNQAEEARALTGLTPDTDPGVESISAGIHAKNKTTLDCVSELADALEIPAPPDGWHDIGDLLTAISDRKKPYTVLMDALDEARSSDLMAIARDLLRELASLPNVRVVVGSRPDRDRSEQPDPSGGSGDGPLVRALAADRVVRLDADPNAITAVADYAEQRLQDVHGSPYAGKQEAARQAAEAVAQHSEGIFLFGRLLARTMARRSEILDLSSAEAQRLLNGSVADSFAADLDRYGEDRQRVQDLLTPLAWTEGAGLPRREVWLAVANAFARDKPERHYDESDLGWLLEHAGAYLIQSGEDGQTVYRLYHQAFNDHLRRGQDSTAVHRTITDTLLALAARNGDVDWPNANPYLHRHLATHAAAAEQLEALVRDSRYLLYADPLRLARVLGALDHRTNMVARLYWRALDRLREATPTERAEILQVTALGSEPEALRRLQTDFELPWRGRWASGSATPFHRRLTGHLESVQTLAIEQLGGRAVVVSGGKDETVRVWNANTGESETVLTGHAGWVQSVAIGPADLGSVFVSGGDQTVRVWDANSGEQRWVQSDDAEVLAVAIGQVNDQPVVVTGGDNQTVRTWNALTGQPQAQPFGHTGAVHAVAIGQLDDQPVIISGGDDHTVRIWNAHTGEEQTTLNGHTGAVHAVAIGQLDDQPVIISGGDDHTVRIWNAHTGEEQTTLNGHTGAVHAVAIGQLDDQPVIISGGDDHTVRIWNAHTGQEQTTLNGHTGAVHAVAIGQLDDQPVIISGGDDHTVRIWNAHTGEEHRLLKGQGPVRAVATGRIDEQPVIIFGGDDYTVRLWNAYTSEKLLWTFDGHTEAVHAVALGQLRGQPVIISGSDDATIRIWNVRTRDQEKSLYGHTGAIHAVAIGQLDDQPVIVSGGKDRSVRVWEPLHRTRVLRSILSGYGSVKALAIGQVDGRALIVSGGNDQTVRIWDAHTGRQRRTLDGHTGSVQSVALGRLAGRALIVSGGNDQTVRIWDAHTGQPKTVLRGHTDRVHTVAFGNVDERPVIVSGGNDQTIRIWDAHTGAARAVLRGHDAVLAVAVGRIADRPVIVSGGNDEAIRIWDADPEEHAVSADSSDAVLAVAFGRIHDRPVIVAGGNDPHIHVWDADTGALHTTLTGPTDATLGVAIGEIHDRPVIVAGGNDPHIHVWDADTGALHTTLTGPTDAVRGVAIGEIHDRPVIVAAGGYDAMVYVWDADTSGPPTKLTGPNDQVLAVAIGAIGDLPVIVAGVEDGAVYVWDAQRIWDAPADELEPDDPDIRELEPDDPDISALEPDDPYISALEPDLIGQTDAVLAVAIGRIGDRSVIVSGDGDGDVYVWDPQSKNPDRPVAALSGHTRGVQAVAIGRIGDRPVIVSAGGTDQTVRVWDAITFEPRVVLSGLSEVVHTVAVEQLGDQLMIFVGGHDRLQAVELLRLPE